MYDNEGIALYEMATGVLPFKGGTLAALFDSILHAAPQSAPRLNPSLPEELGRILSQTIEKDREIRYQTASDLRADLKRLRRASDSVRVEAPAPAPAVSTRKNVIWKVLAAVVVIPALAAGYFYFPRRSAELRIGQTRQLTFGSELDLDPVLSPDGKIVAYASGSFRRFDIYVRQLAGGEPVNLTKDLPGSHRSPRWSADGTSISFESIPGEGNVLIQTVPYLGGTAKRLAEMALGRNSPISATGHAWSPDGRTLAYAQANAIYIRSDGGDPVKVADAYEPHSLK